MGDLGDRREVRGLGEPNDREVRRMHSQDRAGSPVRERPLEVRGARPVRRPHLDELRAGAADDVRDPHPSPDLHEFAARDGDPAAATHEPHRERHGRRVVVRDERVLRTRQRDQVFLGEAQASPPATGLAIDLEQEVVRGLVDDLGGVLGPRRAPEVRMDDHAGPVDDQDGVVAGPGLEPRDQPVGQVVGRRGGIGPLRSRRKTATLLVHDLAGGGRQRRRVSRDIEFRAHGCQDALDTGRSRAVAGWHRRQSLHVLAGTRGHGGRQVGVAGTRGSRTHRAAPSAAPLVLKTRGPTGTRPLPRRW